MDSEDVLRVNIDDNNDTLVTANPIVEQTWITRSQHDDDWFRITVDSGYERLKVSLLFSHAEGDIDLELINPSGTVLNRSNSSTDNETIDYTVPNGGGTYYLRVYYGNAGNTYDIWWDDIPPRINGVCGNAQNHTFTSAPASSLCAEGTASAVTGNGPWSWTCAGSGGGTNTNCSANITSQCESGPLIIGPTSYDSALIIQSESTIATNGIVSVTANANIAFEAGSGITLKPGFTAVRDAVFNARVISTNCAN
jgi:hypothetical protein